MKGKGVLQYLADETNKLNFENQNGMQTIKTLVGLFKKVTVAIKNHLLNNEQTKMYKKELPVVTAADIEELRNR